jgi:hypothetical protein
MSVNIIIIGPVSVEKTIPHDFVELKCDFYEE